MKIVFTMSILALGLATSVAGQTPSDDAMKLEQEGNLSQAAQAWRAVTEHNPKDAGAYASLGVVLSKEEKYGEAAAAYSYHCSRPGLSP